MIFSRVLAGCLGLAWALAASATNIYVVVPALGAAQYPYTNWSMAATNIQDAVNAINTNGGNYVFVSNGTYYLTNQIVITNVVILQSRHDGVSDRTNTIIHGNNYTGKPVTNRCVYMAGCGVTLVGFTITGGSATGGNYYACCGGGVFITNNGALSDCIISSNQALGSGAGGGIFSELAVVIVTNCVIISNRASAGGGFYCDQGTNTLRNCLIAENTCPIASGAGGGGGFMYGYRASNIIERCVVRENLSLSTDPGGGGILLRNGAMARNCLVISNSTYCSGGGICVWGNGNRVVNCTITENSAINYDRGGGLGDNVTGEKSYMENSIVYGNKTVVAGVYSNYYNANVSTWTNCCSAPSLNDIGPGTNVNNITDNPQFAGASTGNFRLARSSPCVNTGTNREWMTPQAGGLDLDGGRRIMMGVVDMGAYELAPVQQTTITFR